jgi:hypothetical protein
MVRSRLIVLFLNLYLLGLLWLVTNALVVEFDHLPSENFGYILFHWVIGITFGTALLTVTCHTAWRIMADRINDDLLFFTAMVPSRHVRGRLVCNLVISLLFYSISAPFLVISYLLRGLDFWMFLYYLPLTFLAVQIAGLVALAVFSAVRTVFQSVFYALLFLTVMGLILGLWVFLLYQIRAANLGTTMPGFRTFMSVKWVSVYVHGLLFLVSIIAVPVTAYLFARCNLSPFSGNRMYPIRRWFSWFIIGTLFFSILDYFFRHQLFPGFTTRYSHFNFDIWSVLGLIITTHWSWWYSYEVRFFLDYWISVTTGILAVMLIIAVCERETWEGRLRRTIPKSIGRRLLVFPLYTGSINALFWVFLWTLLFTITFSVFMICVEYFNDMKGQFAALRLVRHLFFLTLIFDYSMTAFFLWKFVLFRWIPREMIWMLTVGMIGTASFLGFFASALLRSSANGKMENSWLLAPNPFWLFFDNGLEFFQPACGFVWFLIIIFTGYPWLRSRFLDFTPNPNSRYENNSPER